MSALGTRWPHVGYWVREFLGENDYGRYLEDWAARHRDAPPAGADHGPLTPREFFAERLRVKYGGPIQRCC
jgi:uncharacterized short protein YbdD (DUF466 family)